MIKKDVVVEETPRRREAFELLRQSLLQAPILVAPDWNKDFHVYVDVSGFCIGSVLSQWDKNQKDHPIFYGSRQLCLAEKNYSPTD